MAQIRLTHKGLGLWVERYDDIGVVSHFEVLFPRAERTRDSAGVSLAPHYPILCLKRDLADGKGPFRFIDLSGKHLDLRKASKSDGGATVRKDFVLGIHATADAPARDRDVVANYPDLAVGMMQLNPGQIRPQGELHGPITFGQHQPKIARAIVWAAEAVADKPVVQILNVRTQEVDIVQLVPQSSHEPDAGDFVLTLQNLSFADLGGDFDPNSTIDEDFAAHYLLAPPIGEAHLPVGELRVTGDTGTLVKVDPTHLCPGSYLAN